MSTLRSGLEAPPPASRAEAGTRVAPPPRCGHLPTRLGRGLARILGHILRHARTPGLTAPIQRPCPWGLPLAAALSLALCLVLLAGPAAAQGVQQRVQDSGTLRVCIWPDYYGVTYRSPRTGQLVGIDIDLSAELARELGVRLQHVDSSFTNLVDDLRGGRCDVAMFAVAMLPQRLQWLRFTRPYLQSDIYAVTTRSNRAVRRWEDIDQPGVVVAVQAGTFMEPVMRASLRQARLVSIQPPATRERELEAGRVDVFMTDYPYSRRLLDNADWATLIAPPRPFHVLPYGYAVAPGDEAWLQRMDLFVQRIQADGRLEAAARRHGLVEIVVR